MKLSYKLAYVERVINSCENHNQLYFCQEWIKQVLKNQSFFRKEMQDLILENAKAVDKMKPASVRIHFAKSLVHEAIAKIIKSRHSVRVSNPY